MTDQIPEWLAGHLSDRAAERERRVRSMLDSLSPEMRHLLHDAAVMGWVQGMRHHDIPIPKDSVITAAVVQECQGMPDLYPFLGRDRHG